MYIIIDRHSLFVFGTRGSINVTKFTYKINGQPYLATFHSKFDARFFLAREKYVFNNPVFDFIEVSVDHPIAKLLLAADCNRHVALMAFDFETGAQTARVVERDQLNALPENIIQAFYASPHKMRERQKWHDQLSDDEINAKITTLLFKGDNYNKLIADTKLYAMHAQSMQKRCEQLLILLAEKGLKELPVFVLATPLAENEYNILAADDAPLFFLSPLEAFVYMELDRLKNADESGHAYDYKVYNLSQSPNIRQNLLEFSINQGHTEINIMLGFSVQPDSMLKSETNLMTFVHRNDMLVCQCESESVAALEYGYCSATPLANFMLNHSPSECEDLIEKFLVSQNASPETLESQALQLLECFRDPKPYNENLPVGWRALF